MDVAGSFPCGALDVVGCFAWMVESLCSFSPPYRAKTNRVYTFSKEHFIREVIDAASSLLVTDMTNDVSDPSLWANLCEHLALVLFDLFRYDLEKTSGRLLRKKPDQERRSYQ